MIGWGCDRLYFFVLKTLNISLGIIQDFPFFKKVHKISLEKKFLLLIDTVRIHE